MISRKQFEEKNRAEWNECELMSESISKGGRLLPHEARSFPARFRKLCQDCGLVEERLYGMALSSRLNQLVMAGFRSLHRSRTRLGPIRFLARTFPGCFKHNLGLFWVSVLLFWVPFWLMFVSAGSNMDWVQSILGSQGMGSLDGMYGKDGDLLTHGRENPGSDFMMFCFYVNNNVGIDFRVFASGILFGVGTLFFTIFNGLSIGASAGYIQETGDPTKFWSFVSSHSAFELIGLHISTMAGLRLGWGLVRPGQLTRAAALVKNGREALTLVLGAGLLTFFAAFIEGFWSAQPLSPYLKYGVGITLWIATLSYLFTGRKEWYERP